jgi:ligand-binding SRPBCC domain-containing protein
VDERIRGLYRQWIHEHTFEARDGGTLAHDHVFHAVPFDWLVHGWLVRPGIEQIFQFRAEALQARFAISKAIQQ